jgi:CheY-like chemotaxis protein
VAARTRILIVEDDADVREALAVALEDEGLAVEVAADGPDGLARLSQGPPPSVILLDLRLRRLGGAAFLHAMRADPRHARVPVVAMTAGPEAGDDPAVRAHLHKPFDLAELLRIVLPLARPTAA